jgi:predicted ATPase
LVLDNCEHLLDAAANFIEDLLRATAALHIVTTSREPLGIEGEQVYQVSPLDTPPERARGASEVLAYDAAQLFCARMREADSAFSLDDVNAAPVAAICRCLDGLPLALELAAARAATLGATTVATRLDHVFDLLTQGRRNSPARHRTLRATLEWSYELLSHDERRVLPRLAVFSGGFTLEAACALVGHDTPPAATEVTDCIARLLVKSFIAAERKELPVRYRLLQTTRAYLLEKLTESKELEIYRRRHAEYFRDVLKAAGSANLASSASARTFGPDIENLRAALAWTFSEPGNSSLGIELAIRSAPLWLGTSLQNECRSWIEKAVAQLGEGGAMGTPDEVVLRSMLALTLTLQEATARFTQRWSTPVSWLRHRTKGTGT